MSHEAIYTLSQIIAITLLSILWIAYVVEKE